MMIVVVQIVNYTLSFLMWMIVGRGFLALITGTRENVMMPAFVKVTEPVYRVARKLLPFAGEAWIPVLSFFLLAAARVALIILLRPAAGH